MFPMRRTKITDTEKSEYLEYLKNINCRYSMGTNAIDSRKTVEIKLVFPNFSVLSCSNLQSFLKFETLARNL